MGGTLPPLPNYPTDPNQPGSTGGTVNPLDIWDLGRLYNVPIYQGYGGARKAKRETNAPPFPEGDLDVKAHNVYSKAQDVFSGYYNSWVKGTSGKDPAAFQQYINLQKSLYGAGFYGQTPIKEIHAGQWTVQTQTALKDALTAYYGAERSGAPITFDEFLAANATGAAGAGGGFYQDGSGSGGKGGGGGGLPSRPTLTDPDTLKLYAQKAAQAALGRNLTPDQLDIFVNQFHQQQTDSFDNALKGKGDVIDKADPRASAIQFVASNNQQEAGQHQVLGYADALLNSMMSGSGQLPSPNVDPTAVTY